MPAFITSFLCAGSCWRPTRHLLWWHLLSVWRERQETSDTVTLEVRLSEAGSKQIVVIDWMGGGCLRLWCSGCWQLAVSWGSGGPREAAGTEGEGSSRQREQQCKIPDVGRGLEFRSRESQWLDYREAALSQATGLWAVVNISHCPQRWCES